MPRYGPRAFTHAIQKTTCLPIHAPNKRGRTMAASVSQVREGGAILRPAPT